MDIDKLVSVPVNLSKLSDVVRNDIGKNTKLAEIGNKIPDIVI